MSKYVIIGASAAGLSAARVFLNQGKLVDLIILEAQSDIPLNKCFFADVLANEKDLGTISVLPGRQQEAIQERIICNARVSHIDSGQKIVLTADGRQYQYDVLLVATGTRVIVPSQFRAVLDFKRIFSFHSTRDMHMLLRSQELFSGTHIAVVGSGLSGLECADALSSLGALVTIIERELNLFPSLKSDAISIAVDQQAKKMGIAVSCGMQVTQVNSDALGVSIAFQNTKTAQYDYLFVCTGQCPMAEVAKSAGLELNQGLVVVNNYLQSSDEHIFAAGDAAYVSHALTGLLTQSTSWPDAMHQGLVAAQNMLGIQKKYPGALPTISSSFFGYKFASLDAHLLCAEDAHTVRMTHDEQMVMLKSHNGTLRAYAMYGTQSLHGVLRRMALSRAPFDDILEQVTRSFEGQNHAEKTASISS